MRDERGPILDQFTGLPIVRQYREQLRYRQAGLCPHCGQVPPKGYVNCEAVNARQNAKRMLGPYKYQPSTKARKPWKTLVKNHRGGPPRGPQGPRIPRNTPGIPPDSI